MSLFEILSKIFPYIVQVVPLVERLFAGASSEEKRAAAIAMIIPVVRAAEAALDKELVDEEELAEAVGEIVDGVVTMLNLFGILKGSETPG